MATFLNTKYYILKNIYMSKFLYTKYYISKSVYMGTFLYMQKSHLLKLEFLHDVVFVQKIFDF